MKKILLAVTALSIALTFSSGCYAQGTADNPGPRVENADTNSENGSDRYIPIGSGAYVYDTETGMTIPNPDWFPISSSSSSSSSSGGSGSGGCDPLTSGWEACVGDSLPDGGKPLKYETKDRTFNSAEEAYDDTQGNSSSSSSSSDTDSSESGEGLDENETVD